MGAQPSAQAHAALSSTIITVTNSTEPGKPAAPATGAAGGSSGNVSGHRSSLSLSLGGSGTSSKPAPLNTTASGSSGAAGTSAADTAAAAAQHAAALAGGVAAPLAATPALPLVFVNGLRPELRYLTSESLRLVDRVQARFEKLFTGFGWRIDEELFEALFEGETIPAPPMPTPQSPTNTNSHGSSSPQPPLEPPEPPTLAALFALWAEPTPMPSTSLVHAGAGGAGAGAGAGAGGMSSSSRASTSATSTTRPATASVPAAKTADVLQLLATLTLVAKADFEPKLMALFDLFDFDGNDHLSEDELALALRSSVLGLCKATAVPQGLLPTPVELDKITTEAFHSADVRKSADAQIARHEFVQWVVCTPKVFATVNRFGTTNVSAVVKRYAPVQARALATRKIQTFYQAKRDKQGGRLTLSQRHTMHAKHQHVVDPTTAAASAAAAGAAGGPGASGGGDARSAAGSPTKQLASHKASQGGSGGFGGGGSVPRRAGERKEFKNLASAESKALAGHFDMRELKKHKAIFDGIDRDFSGSISVKELAEFFRTGPVLDDPTRIFASIDSDGSGSLSFEELLKCLYPYKTSKELKLMAASVDVPEVTQALLQDWAQRFEDADTRMLGHVAIGQFLSVLKQAPDSRKYAPFLKGYVCRNPDLPVTFRQFITEVFATQPPFASHLKAIVATLDAAGAAVAPRALSDTQLKEMEDAFRLFDRDGSGSVSISELEAYFLNGTRPGGGNNSNGSNNGQSQQPGTVVANALGVGAAQAGAAAQGGSKAGAADPAGLSATGLRRSDLVALFKELDKNRDNRMSFDEFKQYFRNLWDTGAGPAGKQTPSSAGAGASGSISGGSKGARPTSALQRQDSKLQQLHSHIKQSVAASSPVGATTTATTTTGGSGASGGSVARAPMISPVRAGAVGFRAGTKR